MRTHLTLYQRGNLKEMITFLVHNLSKLFKFKSFHFIEELLLS